MEGQILGGRYEILRELGRGGMGAVYEARHTGTSRRVAVKVITADLLKTPGLVQRFEVEARAAGGIESQHVAQVLDAGHDEAHAAPYIVMEFLSGEDLHQLVHRLGPLPVDLALRIVAQACLGLDKAHKAKIIHRDVKPANIYLNDRDGDEVVVKILDFGVAKIRMEEGQNLGVVLTRTGSLLGSPLYMSPEQARGDKLIDQRSDLWSLGIVLYEALVGQTPYHEIEALGSLILAICGEPPAPIQGVAPWISPDVAAVVHKALTIRPEDRFQSAGEMYRAIKALLPGGHGIDKSMLVTLSAEERALRPPPMPATALVSIPSQPGLGISGRASSSSSPGMAGRSSGSPPAGSSSVPGDLRSPGISDPPPERASSPERARTTAGLTSDPLQPAGNGARSKLPMALGAVAIALGAVFFAIRSSGPPATSVPAVQAAQPGVPAVTAPAATVAPEVTPAPAVSASASASAMAVDAADAGKAAGRPLGKGQLPKSGPAVVAPAAPAPSSGAKTNVGGRIIRTDLP